MKQNEMIPSKYLKQDDVDGDHLVTVVALKKTNVARDDEAPDMEWVIQFAEFDKPMVLNTTNKRRLFKALGDDSDDWIDGKMILYVDPDVEYAGKITGGLRLRAAPPAKRPNRKFAVTDSSGETFVDDVPFE